MNTRKTHTRTFGCALGCRTTRRRGNVAVVTAVSIPLLLGFVALAVDVGLLYNTRAELQRSADAAAMAAAWELLDRDRLAGAPNATEEMEAARQAAQVYAGLNKVLQESPTIDPNSANAMGGDVVIGYLNDPTDRSESISTTSPNGFNTVYVRVRRDAGANGAVPLFFANIFGFSSASLGADAAAVFKDGVVGYRVTERSGNADLLPLALHVNAWNALRAGTMTTGDNYSYSEVTGQVSAASDGVLELNLYPGSGTDQLPPGNFGTVDIGNPNNSTADISRQIREGVSAQDLAYFGGELRLNANGTLPLEGDTGLSAAIKDDLEAIKGQPRAIPLFNQVSGPGNNAVFTIVGFAGIRIVDVKLTGPMTKKHVIIQPAFVVDDAAITDAGPGNSSFVYEPVKLVR